MDWRGNFSDFLVSKAGGRSALVFSYSQSVGVFSRRASAFKWLVKERRCFFFDCLQLLDKTSLLGKKSGVHVRLTDGADKSTKSNGVEGAGVATLRVDLTNGQLDGSVISSSDQSVGGRALAGDVKIHVITIDVLHLERLVCC